MPKDGNVDDNRSKNQYTNLEVGESLITAHSLPVQKDTKEYILYSPNTLNHITDNMFDIFEVSINFYKKLFDIEEFRKIQINYFDNKDEFREYIYTLRGERESLPNYAAGTFDRGMINGFIDNKSKSELERNSKILYNPSHELFHIMYRELVLDKEHKPRIVWFDEGCAQFFSGEQNKNLSDENFENWFNLLKRNTKEIPNINKLRHGNEFKTEKYDGYKLSFLAVKYLYEKLSLDNFKKLMYNTDDIIKYGDTVLYDAINYYSLKYRKEKDLDELQSR